MFMQKEIFGPFSLLPLQANQVGMHEGRDYYCCTSFCFTESLSVPCPFPIF